jgi:hypothetical protein
VLYLQFVLAAGGKRELSGKLEQKDAYMVRIRITNSGSADASGSILIDYTARKTRSTPCWGADCLTVSPSLCNSPGVLPCS